MGGINHYQYAPNPVNWVDPFGLSCKEGIIYRMGRGSDMYSAIKATTTANIDFDPKNTNMPIVHTISVVLQDAFAVRKK